MRDALIWPSREGVKGVGGLERSRFRDVDCLRAVLKRVFWKGVLDLLCGSEALTELELP